MIPPGIVKTTYADGSARYHNGTIFDGAAPKNIGPYTDNGVTVDSHYWCSWWRYRPNPIAVVRSPAEIVAANQAFPYGNTGLPIGSFGNFTFKGPMDGAGLTVYMPTTGERAEIGLITDPSAKFMLGGSPASMIAWAQANDSYPIHFRDENTGKPIDLLKYPKANANDRPGLGVPWLQTFTSEGPEASAWLYPQQAHYYELSYVAYLATLDPGFLENVQYNANFTVLCDAWFSASRNLATIHGEYRGIAWALRNLFMAHIATKDAEARGILPDSCHPSSYWKALLDNQLSYFSQFMDKPDHEVFRLIYDQNGFAPWQADFVLQALAFGVLTGHSDWTTLYLWCLKNAIDRTSGKSGYPVGWGVAYYMHSDMPDWYSSWLRMAPDWTSDSKPPTQEQIDILKADPFNGGKAMTGAESLMSTRAVLVMAQYLDKKGLAKTKAAYADLDTCVINVERMLQGSTMNPRQSVVLDASGVPDTIPPLPPVTPPITPPTGEITMSDPAFNAPFTATVSFKDNKGNAMVPDTVSWNAPAAFALTQDQTDKLKAHGVYGAEGASDIKVIGVKDGISVTVTKGVTVPAAVPFLASGRIELS